MSASCLGDSRLDVCNQRKEFANMPRLAGDAKSKQLLDESGDAQMDNIEPADAQEGSHAGDDGEAIGFCTSMWYSQQVRRLRCCTRRYGHNKAVW